MAEIERIYTIPLRREFLKVPKYKRAKKSVKAVKEFLIKHMKSTDVAVGNSINLEIWKHGAENPPHHIKVSVKKEKDGKVRAELFGAKPKKEETKKEKKAKKQEKAEKKKEQKETEKEKKEEPKEKKTEMAKGTKTKQKKNKPAEKTSKKADKKESKKAKSSRKKSSKE